MSLKRFSEHYRLSADPQETHKYIAAIFQSLQIKAIGDVEENEEENQSENQVNYLLSRQIKNINSLYSSYFICITITVNF